MKLLSGSILGLLPIVTSDPPSKRGPTLRPSGLKVIRQAGPSATCDWFQQPIDHHNKSLGTWSQLYCVNPAHWSPGSPVVLMTPGETPIWSAVDAGSGISYLDDTTMPGIYARAIGAAVVVIEHRYFGGSSPYDGLNAETLQYLTLEQAALDLVNFAQNIKFRFDSNQSSIASKAPWVYYGASYSATLGNWLERFHQGVFHAYHLSSATIEATADNWYYYDTIRKGIDSYRKDTSCSSTLNEIVDYVDSFLLSPDRNETKVKALKQYFGALYPIYPIDDDDFAYALATPFHYWEETNGYREILDLCNVVVDSWESEEHDILGTIPASVVNFAAYWRMNFRDSTCSYFNVWGQQDPLWCLHTRDPLNPFYTARTLGNPWRTRLWFLCNEPLASWGVAAPENQPTIVSRKIDAEYFLRQCERHFPAINGKQYGSSKGKTPQSLNELTGGWSKAGRRVIYTSGEFDPWRGVGMASEVRPGGPLRSSDDVAVFVIKGAQFAADRLSARGMNNLGLPANQEVVKVQEAAVEILKGWLDDWKATSKR